MSATRSVGDIAALTCALSTSKDSWQNLHFPLHDR
jgi:hypothetical protein